MSEARVVLHPPAKLNLTLDVLFKRDDGYHEIESVMQAITLTDSLEVERRDAGGLVLEVSGRECPVAGNLVTTAAERYFAATGRPFGVHARLDKRIPLGAGLGGGSSDAASMLVALARLDREPLPTARLAEVAASIGSDVPFFLHCAGGGATTVIARGRGERIEPVADAPRFRFVVLYPGVVAPTARVYANVNLDLTRRRADLRNPVRMTLGGPAADRFAFPNALEAPFRSLYPEVARLQDRVSAETGREFRVTGSGSAMFTTVEDAAQGARVIQTLQAVAAGESCMCSSLAS